MKWFTVRWYAGRITRLAYLAPLSTARLAMAIIPEIWREKLVVNVIALSVDEENSFREAREKLARFLGVKRISPEEYFMLVGAIMPFYLGQREERLAKSELSRMLFNRRRFRPNKEDT